MRACESVQNYDSRIREYVNYSYRQSRNVCKNIGKREAGSENEKQLQQHIKAELETCADEVISESFRFSNNRKVLQNKVCAAFILLAFALIMAALLTGIYAMSYASVAVAVIGIILGFSGKLYSPKKLTTENVYGVKQSTGVAKNRIILVGNADCERFTKLISPFLKAMSIFSAVIIIAVSAIVIVQNMGIVSILPEKYYSYASIVICVFSIFNIIGLFGGYCGVSDGANKNLTGSFTSLAVLKFLKDMDISFENTEIGVLVTGAHEADMSGAKAFTEKHSDKLKNIPTKVLCLDCLREENDLRIVPAKTGSAFAKKIMLCSKQAGSEIDIKGEIKNSDAEAFAKTGVEACTITASPSSEKAEDTYEDMKIKTIETTLKCVMETVFELDSEA